MPLWLPLVRADARLAVLAPGQWAPAGRLVRCSPHHPSHGHVPKAPSVKSACWSFTSYQPGIKKSGSVPCAVEFLGRRGKPVKKMRLIPAHKAFAFARKLQGTPGCTVSVC